MQVLATAGHVDHGKSALVRALTGTDPDRLAEERRRGLTLDLGHAWTTLPGGAVVAFVDVPGHQRYLATTIAGLGPSPGVVFVVAADAGWSRQSEEHLAAVDALGVGHGLLAVTRSDLADPGPALAAARRRIADSSLGEVPGVAVSSVTGAGLDELRGALAALVARMPGASPAAAVRLWVDRSFTVRGSGTVVTGTLPAGTVRAGDRLDLRGEAVRVRGLQSLGQPVEQQLGPARLALNLAGVGADDVGRGDALLTPGAFWRTDAVDVVSSGTMPADVLVHAGTASVPGRWRPLADGFARVALSSPLPLRYGDRLVVRDPGRQDAGTGAVVLDVDPPPLRRRGAARARARDLADLASGEVGIVGLRGAERGEVLVRQGFSESGKRVAAWLVDEARLDAWAASARTLVDDRLRVDPLAAGVPAGEAVRRLALPDADLLRPVAAHAGLRLSGGWLADPEAARPSAYGPGLRALTAALSERPWAAPDAGQLTGWRLGPAELAAAERAGAVVRLGGGVVVLPGAEEAALARLRELPQPFGLADAREALGVSRRVLLPLLERLDATRSTERVGDLRRVRP